MSTARRIIESYDPEIRATLKITAEEADDPSALIRQIRTLGSDAEGLLGSLWLAVPPGEKLPERLRGAIEKWGAPLWMSGLLLPRTSGSKVHPAHYSGSCQLNPALSVWRASWLELPELHPVAAFPPSDARWDSVLIAARLEREPIPLTQGGLLRKDTGKKLAEEESQRWNLALAVARVNGLVRPVNQRLVGFPEAPIKPLHDPSLLFTGTDLGVVSGILRLTGEGWLGVDALLQQLRRYARQAFHSPNREGFYQEYPTILFDNGGWEKVEEPLVQRVLDVLHRCGFLDAARDHGGVTAVRLPGRISPGEQGFIVTPDLELHLPVGGLSAEAHGRIARLAPYVGGERVHRHRITREGVQADIDAGHGDIGAFLQAHARNPLPPNVNDALEDWKRQATRFLLLTGVDIIEDSGKFRIGSSTASPSIDYARSAAGGWRVEGDELVVDDGNLLVRAALNSVLVGGPTEGNVQRFRLGGKKVADVPGALERLAAYGSLPAMLDLGIRLGSGTELRKKKAWLLQIPEEVAVALDRDPSLGAVLQRVGRSGERLVEEAEVPRAKERLAQLGLRWPE